MSRTTTADEQEEALAVGRVLGKADKDFIKKLDLISKQKKKKKSEIVKEAIELYEKLEMLQGLDSKSLMAGFLFWRELMEMGIESLAKLSPIYSSALVQAQMQTIAQVLENANRIRQEQQQSPSPSNTEDPTKSIIDNVRATLLQKVLDLVMNMMANTTLSPTAPTQNLSQLSSNSQSQSSSQEVPIEVINDENQ